MTSMPHALTEVTADSDASPSSGADAAEGRLKLTACGLTDTGRRREHNEDVFGIDGEHGLYIVCDGMGGHACGEVASALARDVIAERMTQAREAVDADALLGADSLTQWHRMALGDALRDAHQAVLDAGQASPAQRGMGTTAVVMQATPKALVVGHVGDSRAYRWRPFSGLERVTRDHSLVNRLVEAGVVRSELEARALNVGNIILRAIGGECGEPEVTAVPRCPGDVFLLCSDGLTDMLHDDAIESILWSCADDLGLAARRLVREANEAGGYDNVTEVLVRLDDDFHALDHLDPAAFLAPLGEVGLDETQEVGGDDETQPDPRALWMLRGALAAGEAEAA